MTFKEFVKLVGKLCHALVAIPAEKDLFAPMNKILFITINIDEQGSIDSK